MYNKDFKLWQVIYNFIRNNHMRKGSQFFVSTGAVAPFCHYTGVIFPPHEIEK